MAQNADVPGERTSVCYIEVVKTSETRAACQVVIKAAARLLRCHLIGCLTSLTSADGKLEKGHARQDRRDEGSL